MVRSLRRAGERKTCAAGARQSRPRCDSARTAQGRSSMWMSWKPTKPLCRIFAYAAAQRACESCDGSPHVITFHQFFDCHELCGIAGHSKRRNLTGYSFASIGPVTSSTLRELGLRVDIAAKEFTSPAWSEPSVRALAASRDRYSVSEQLQSAGTTCASRKSATRL